VLQSGTVFEKAGVNVSAVYGQLSKESALQMRSHGNTIHGDGDQQAFFATGVSMVLHPWSPMVPTVHPNYRCFELQSPDGQPVDCWFGGGADLTPRCAFSSDPEIGV
jgi:coproporphyrinogen III oxidase